MADIYQTITSVLKTGGVHKVQELPPEAQQTFYMLQAHLTEQYPGLDIAIVQQDVVPPAGLARFELQLRKSKANEDLTLLQLLLQFLQVYSQWPQTVVSALGIKMEDVRANEITISDVVLNIIQGEQPAAPGEPPYKGMKYFDVDDAALFYGRETLTAELVEYLHTQRFMAVIGASGSGKSSLVRAGLIPTLQGKKPLEGTCGLPPGSDKWQYLLLTPTTYPLTALANALIGKQLAVDPNTLIQELLEDACSLHRRAQEITDRTGASRIIIVVDQFEELFTLSRSADPAAQWEHEQYRKAFVDNLLNAAAVVDGPTLVVITMRADFYGHCDRYDNLRTALGNFRGSCQKYIGSMNRDELRRAIEMPLQIKQWVCEQALVDQLLFDIGNEPGALPLLSHALLETWNQRSGRRLTLAGYIATGRIQGAIAKTAEAVYTKEFRTPQQQTLVRNLFMRLTEPGESTEDTRRRIAIRELIAQPEERPAVEAILQKLTAAHCRLIVRSDEQVEVAHEAIIRRWPRLREWMDKHRQAYRELRELSRSTQKWLSNGRRSSYLAHQGTWLTTSVELVEQAQLMLSQDEQQYLTECTIRQRELEAVEEDIQLSDIAKMGWGVIFPAGVDVTPLREALAALLAHRQQQVGDRYREFSGADGYRPGESARDFLRRFGVGYGRLDAGRMPYYLLLVGDPETIPFSFQYQLDIQAAVGRIHFDTLEEYRNYARSVVMAEVQKVTLPRNTVFFGVENADDRATHLSTAELVIPLSELLIDRHPQWHIEPILREAATKEQLARLMGGDQTPALLFTVSHGVPFTIGSERQITDQGALLCSDWPGPKAWRGRGAIPQEYYFAGRDLAKDARLLGSIFFLWSCYSGGTPRVDNFPKPGTIEPQQIAPYPFLARLPQALLSHPKGGALAVIGRVERAWGASFIVPGNIGDWLAFRLAFDELLRERPVGLSINHFNQRYVELSAALISELEKEWMGEPLAVNFSSLKTATFDARNYLILGDPAVRLRVAAAEESLVERPTLGAAMTVPTAQAVVAQPEQNDERVGISPQFPTTNAVSAVGELDSTDTAPADSGGTMIWLNGVDGRRGTYLDSPLHIHHLAQRIQAHALANSLGFDISLQAGIIESSLNNHANPANLAEVGWGVIFASDADPAVRAALAPLLAQRRQQAGDLYHEFSGPNGYRAGESALEFLQRHGADTTEVNPQRVPYYLFLVGDTTEISMRFQQQLDLQYACGRIAFERVEQYAAYGRNIIQSEQTAKPQRALLFGPSHASDMHTTLLTSQLLQPLADALAKRQSAWTIEGVLADRATSASLQDVLRNDAPSLLLLAGHGVGFPASDPLRREYQGSLLCGGWPALQQGQWVFSTDDIVSAQQIDDQSRLTGTIVFLLNSYSVMTPSFGGVSRILNDPAPVAATANVISPLASKLLSHAAGAALAVVGFTDQMTSYSFDWERNALQTLLFTNLLNRVLDHQPLGLAVELANGSYLSMSNELATELNELKFGKAVDHQRLVSIWTAEHDMRNLTILGDPAVRITSP